MTDVYAAEQLVVSDVERSTGHSFVHIAAIDTGDKLVAEVVLPILCRWVPAVEQKNIRQAIYSRFITPHAWPYIDCLADWLRHESDELARDWLVQALAVAVRAEDAERVWNLRSQIPQTLSHYALLAKLASFPSIKVKVKDEIAQAIEHDELRVDDLQYVAKIEDARIRRWFERNVDSPNPTVRTIARRVVERGKRLPRGAILAASPPERQSALYSTDVDLDELGKLFQLLASEHGVKTPAAIQSSAFFSRLPLDQWVVVHAATKGGDPMCLWFRLEDIDVVEVVLTEAVHPGTPTIS